MVPLQTVSFSPRIPKQVIPAVFIALNAIQFETDDLLMKKPSIGDRRRQLKMTTFCWTRDFPGKIVGNIRQLNRYCTTRFGN